MSCNTYMFKLIFVTEHPSWNQTLPVFSSGRHKCESFQASTWRFHLFADWRQGFCSLKISFLDSLSRVLGSVRGAFLVFPFFVMKHDCSTMLCHFLLYKEVYQPYVYIYSFPLGPSSHPSSSSQSTQLSSLYYTACSHQLPSLHMVVNICRS